MLLQMQIPFQVRYSCSQAELGHCAAALAGLPLQLLSLRSRLTLTARQTKAWL